MNYNILDELIAQTKISKKPTDKQQKVIEAAIKLFAEKGFANTSTSEIAKEAGVAEGTIFRHFGSKDNLLLSIILPFIKKALPTMADGVFKEILSKNPPTFEDFFRRLLEDRLRFFVENKEIFQVVVKEFVYNENLRQELSPLFIENIATRLEKVIEMYKQKGEIIDFEAANIRKILFTFVGGYFISKIVLFPHLLQIDDEENEQLVHFVMNGIKRRDQ